MVHINNVKAGTYEEFLEKGYRPYGEPMKQLGYVSRKPLLLKNSLVKPVYIAGRGRRAGQLFILIPCFTSTRFCYRMYLKKV